MCSELPTTDVRSFKRPMGTPAISEPQCDAFDKMSGFGVEQSAEPYKCKVGDETRCYCSSEQSTEPSQQLIAAPFLVPQQHGILDTCRVYIHLMYCNMYIHIYIRSSDRNQPHKAMSWSGEM